MRDTGYDGEGVTQLRDTGYDGEGVAQLRDTGYDGDGVAQLRDTGYDGDGVAQLRDTIPSLFSNQGGQGRLYRYMHVMLHCVCGLPSQHNRRNKKWNVHYARQNTTFFFLPPDTFERTKQ